MNRMSVRSIAVLGALCALTSARVAAADSDLFVCRFTSTTGTLDPTFNNTAGFGGPGCWRVDDGPNGTNDEFNDVAIDSAGRIVACGNVGPQGGSTGFMITRYLSNGTIDPNFSPANWGFVQLPWPAARACATDSSGRIVAAAAFGPPTDGIVVVRFNAFDGSRDWSFGPFGTGYEWLPMENASVADLKITADGRIWVAGDGVGFNVARLTPNGVADTTYGGGGGGGLAAGFWNQTYALTVDSSGRAVLAVRAFPNTSTVETAAARFTPQGDVDLAFGTRGDGIAFPGSIRSHSSGVAIDSNGWILLSGYVDNGTGYDFALARVHPTGRRSVTIRTRFASPWASPSTIALTTDGKIFLAGFQGPLTTDGSQIGHTSIALARYTLTGIDTTFSNDGMATHDFVTTRSFLTGLAVDASGRPVVTGFTSP